MENYNGNKRPFLNDSRRRSYIPRERRPHRQFNSTLLKTITSQPLSMDELNKMAQEKPDDLILNVIKKLNVIVSMLENATIEHKIMERVILILGKATTSRLQSEVNSMISSLSNCKMFYSIHVPQYLASFHQLGLRDNYSECLDMLTELLIKFHHSMPCTAMETTSVLFPLLESTVKMLLPQKENLNFLLEKIVETNMRNQEFLQSIKPKEVKFKTAKERLHLQKPPENFRTIPILPTPEDIYQPCTFLRPNWTKGEYVDAEHYLDVQFRLLREDYIKPLRDGISEYLRLKEKKEPLTNVQDAIIHSEVYIVEINFKWDKIIHTALFVDKSFYKINWKESKRFLNGSLLCFSDNDFQTFYLATVIERKEISKGRLMLEFENPTEDVLNIDQLTRFVVIETSAYFEAYKHNLTALSLLNDHQLPMQPYIIKVKSNVDLPAYLKEDDCLDVRTLFDDFKEVEGDLWRRIAIGQLIMHKEMHSQFKKIHILDDESWPTHSDLNLDPFQLAAIKAALTKEFCIIQGPPGTGKTFISLKIVRVLLNNKHKWNSENSPLLVVCYTNHALDQFLEGLLEFTSKIVRIGGASSNGKIDEFNIRNLRRGCGNFKEEYKSIEEYENRIISIDKLIEKSNSYILEVWRLEHIIPFHQYKYFMLMRESLSENTNLLYEWLNHGNEDPEWKTVGKKSKNSIKDILDSTEAMSENEAKRIVNLFIIPLKRRWRLYKTWLNQYLVQKRAESLRYKASLKSVREVLRYKQLDRDVYLCRCKDVIGMTTTGAAKNKDLLRELDPKILVVEEAAEILESHVVTSLSPGTEHVILIGDHQQLRPNPTVHSLAVNYDLNISLFERMIMNGMKYNKLNLQHRMRPEIASLLVPHIYKDLTNHESVEKFENVKGMAKNLFFMTHGNYETSSDSKTKTNLFEAKFIVKLYEYLILQGYKSSQITILTTYVGQMYTIKKELNRVSSKVSQVKGKATEKVINKLNHNEDGFETDWADALGLDEEEEEDGYTRVTVVDNYQGEENDIILISFVRSNAEGRIGFLKISNRVCVALSRAKKGFFGIGNFEFLANESDLWKKITDKLKEQDSIGPSFQLKCQNHPDTSVIVMNEKDFNSVPEGGCTRDCEFRLECGHQCALKCHPYDKEHIDIKCFKPCNKHCRTGHLCTRKCYEDCGDCFSMIDKVVDVCGHETKVFCYRKLKKAVCPELCPYFFKCLYSESKVKGVLENVFFVSSSLDNKSKFNFMEKFQEYLCRQGYEEYDVHILSESDPESVLEAGNKDLILAIFPDCSDDNEFLVASTEIFITLSTAKKGIFCIGNFDLFAKKFEFWNNVISALKQKDKIGPTLSLQCQNHPEIHEVISSEKDFYSVKEGGCTKQCEFKLPCDHTCFLKCHTYDIEHKKVMCHLPCMRKCAFNHSCMMECCKNCVCAEKVDKKLEPCGHIEKVECFLQNDPIKCSQSCEKYLSCGHKCTSLCSERCETNKCKEIVTIKLPECQHDCEILCWKKSTLTLFSSICEKPCETMLACGHVCSGTCRSCKQGRLHVLCKNLCQRDLICGHGCTALCFETCPPCKNPCQEICEHGVCPKLCGEPCDPCNWQCEWKCSHKKCNNLCHEKCDRTPCDESCTAVLQCGHPCIGLCGEPCPSKCKICDEDSVRIACGGIDLPNSKFVSLENCSHIFEVSVLTERIIQDSRDNSIHNLKCPSCNKVVLKNFRFGNVIKTYLEDREKVKRITSGDEVYNYKLKFDLLKVAKKMKTSKLKKALIKKCVSPSGSIQELNVMENFVAILLNFDSLFFNDTKIYNFIGKVELKLFDSTMNIDLCDKLQSYIEKAKDWMTDFILENSFQASMEQLKEFSWEAYRVALADKLMKTLNSIPKLTFDASQQLNELMDSLLTTIPFRGEDAEKLHSTFEKFLILTSEPESEKLKIPSLKSVSLSKGTWFSCQKGHVFSSITCLKTLVERSCYECDPSISIVPTIKEVPREKIKPLLSGAVNRFRHRIQELRRQPREN